ncbi:G-type lectin S-receptor-like serine/threonine-protein kinase SD2-5 [Cryptomeria japonica]|uniref:G-type lectin S-receptor-like serine/threonine-protein kinase SD2-5 n=1 Tax=Cryptomeria japonica TaxID=3369 RepID=UPI0027DA391C|nr:G-type lectin S-receptor-like serine/threonine-protein kinase SD2-5 [Cryptomeria japonica]
MEKVDSLISSFISISFIVHVFLQSSHVCVQSFRLPSPTGYGGTTWINNIQSLDSWTHQLLDTAAVTIRPILLSNNISYAGENLQYGCGFFCYAAPCDTGYSFAVFFVIYNTSYSAPDLLQMVWTTNGDRLVQDNATLGLTPTGDLVLKDADGTLVWSTNTFTNDFQGMVMEESGNLVLLNSSNGTMWQSFDHPTDTLLSGQKMMVGQNLTAYISLTNTSTGMFYGSLNRDGFALFTATTPPQMYFRSTATDLNFSFIRFDNRSLLYYLEGSPSNPIPIPINISIPHDSLYLKISYDGHMKFYSLQADIGIYDLDFLSVVNPLLSRCDYPTICGQYGMCTTDRCDCPGKDKYFFQIDPSNPSSGCTPYNPLVCSRTPTQSSRTPRHSFLQLEHVSYFSYRWENDSIGELVTGDYCRNLCSTNCSCKAAFFLYGFNANSSLGYCFIKSSVFSFQMNNKASDLFYNSTAYIKFQPKPKRVHYSVIFITVSLVGGSVALFLFLWVWIYKFRKGGQEEQKNDEDLDFPAGSPVRYSFEELQKATNDFSLKLGSGGFGSVYEGILLDDTKIAVKRLDRAGEGSKEFRAEVETLGNIHHLNLVRLKGFCAEKSHRMLVYEYLPNGSLDKWIFPNESRQHLLDWKTRSKVILHIARGLSYLHEECRERIIHFDIKPQNILLDENFNAKVSDFGLAKLINREQNEVITMLRGTPGYMAPELLDMEFTEKADIYSFGVMVVEILSGRRSRELTQPGSGLFPLLQRKAEEGGLVDLVDTEIKDEGIGAEQEAAEVLGIALCCIQYDFTKRPAMSTVVKALENMSEMDQGAPVFTVSPSQPLLFSEDFTDKGFSSGLSVFELSGPR